MPPKTKTPEQIRKEQTKIINNALKQISEKGYQNLTMRSLATFCKISPTKIYYYFSNKEDVYLNVMEAGFRTFLQKMMDAYDNGADEKARFVNVCNALFDFGIHNANYYEIMLSSRTPRPLDYIEGPMESIAIREKASGVAFYEFWEKCTGEFGTSVGKELTRYQMVLMFSQIHGAINLAHSGNLREVGFDNIELNRQIINHLVAEIENPSSLL